jgi:agmatine deiminase
MYPEWYPQEMVQLVFPHQDTDWKPYLQDAIDTFVQLAKIIQRYQKVLIITSNLAYTKSLFTNKKNLIFIKLPSNDTWSRDFGGITVSWGNKPTILDFQFNGWGKKYQYNLDNQITTKLKLKGIFKKYNYKSIPFVLEGGSIDVNSQGVLLTTTQCLLEKNRNPKFTKNKIEQMLKQTLSIKKVLWLEHGALKGDDTDSHIDTLARFVNDNTIVYQTAYKDDPNYQELKKMEQELKKFKDINNKPFYLIPLPSIKPIFYEDEQLPATYANFLIINKAVIVPTYNDSNDINMISLFKKLFPNRAIIPLDATTLIKQHGSIHCVTMQYPAV